MFNLLRTQSTRVATKRFFSSTSSRQSDLAKLILIGRLGREPEMRQSSNMGKEYMTYTVATNNFPPPPQNPDGSREPSRVTWHHVVSFNPNTFDYLKNLRKGSHVYVEANYELREADPLADPDSPQGQRQIFLRHEMIRLLKSGPSASDHGEHSDN